MAWLQRLFGMVKPDNAQVNPVANADNHSSSDPVNSTGTEVPPERLGLNGEYDQNGLAKRVALAFDEDGRFDDIESLYVAQLGSRVVLKGEIPSQDILEQLVEISRGVTGATDVLTDQVVVG
jgi:osmotically-inducible protein OsmY